MQLDGTLDKFPLRELIEMVAYSSVTGVLEVHMGADVGQIFFSDGRPYHAIAGPHTGIDATAALFELRSAPFRFVADKQHPESTLWQDTWEIIERSEDLSDKWIDIRSRIPSMSCVPSLCDDPAIGQVQISDITWPVLAAIDGVRTVEQISEHLNLMLLDCCVSLVALLDRGLIAIRLSQSPSQPPQLPLPTQSTTPPAHSASSPADGPAANPPNGFLERLLAEAQAREQDRPALTDDEAQDRKRVYRYVDDRR